MMLLLFLCFAILNPICCTDSKTNGERRISDIQKVKEKLLKSYDKDVRPGEHHNITTMVYFDIIPLYLIDLDEERSLFTLDSWFILIWTDDRLKWNRTEYDALEIINLPSHYVWLPDLRVYNAHSSNVDPKVYFTHVIVWPTGTVLWVPPATVTTVCDVTTPTDSYPYDKHQCNITVGMWTHHGWQIDVQVRGDRTIDWEIFFNTSARWEVIAPECGIRRRVIKYECCEEPFLEVDVTFSLRRRMPAHLQVVRAPCMLVMVLTLAMFWIRSDSGKKITLGSSLLIILTALTIYCAAMTKSPRAPLLAVSFIQSTMIAVTSALFLEVVIIGMGRLSGPRRPPEFLVGLLSGQIGDYICTNAAWKQIRARDKIRLDEDTEPVNLQPTPKQEWLLVASGFDRVLFLVYIVVFSVIHQL